MIYIGIITIIIIDISCINYTCFQVAAIVITVSKVATCYFNMYPFTLNI